MMISSPNIVGLRTSIAASRTTSSRAPVATCPRRAAGRVLDHDHRAVDDQPEVDRAQAHQAAGDARARSMRSNANSIDSGMASATIRPARRLPRNTNSTAMTSSAPSSRLLRPCEHVVDELGPLVDRRRPRRPRAASSRPPRAAPARRRDLVAVLAHQHEAEAEHDLALAVGGHRAAADLVALDDLGDVAHADRRRRPARDTMSPMSAPRSEPDALDEARLAGRIELPPPTLALLRARAPRSALARVRPYGRSAAPGRRRLDLRSSPPHALTSATPGTERSCGAMTQSCVAQLGERLCRRR
jgi:hypothetical protein